MSYFVNSVNVRDILMDGNIGNVSTARNVYLGFPNGQTNDNQTLCQCLPFGYTINGTDVSTYYRAYQIFLTADSANNSIRTIVNLANQNTPNGVSLKTFKHMSAIGIAGGGGGGGRGGAGWQHRSGNRDYRWGAGGWGGFGAWCKIDKVSIKDYNQIRAVVGNGGKVGKVGDDSNTPKDFNREGGKGYQGDSGNGTYIYGFTNTDVYIVGANGGVGGRGGDGARIFTDYTTPAYGRTLPWYPNVTQSGNILVANGDNGGVVGTYNFSNHFIALGNTAVPNFQGDYGRPGVGIAFASNNYYDGTGTGGGREGIVWAWLLYDKDN